MELNSFKEVANNIGEGCGNVPIVLVRCTVGDILFILYVCLFVCSFQGFLAMVCLMPYKIDTTEIQLMELNSFKEVANNIGEGCGNVPIVLVRCTVGDISYLTLRYIKVKSYPPKIQQTKLAVAKI